MSNSKLNKKSIEDVDVKGKRVLLRCDLNVPIHDGKITDDSRIKASIPTIKYLVDHGARVVICSHLGKPEKRQDLEPVCKALSKACKLPIKFVGSDRVVDDNVVAASNELKDGELMMIQNTRWRDEESKNEDNFSKELASLCDIFVYDAFGTCHRAHSSTAGVTKFVKESVCGYLIKKELDNLCNYIDNPKKPFVTILGGSKISDKLKVIDKMDKDYMGLDVGKKTIELMMKHMINAKTILWNGPVGLFETQKFALGTYSIAACMAKLKDAVTIIGGGDSASAVNHFKLADKMTHISTGGGATLDFLKGEPLPGIESLTNK